MNNPSLEALRKKQAQLQARIQMLQAREEMQRRKNDTRKKILIGSYFLDKYEKENARQILIAELDKFLFRKRDRELFGLAPRGEEINHQSTLGTE